VHGPGPGGQGRRPPWPRAWRGALGAPPDVSPDHL